VNKHPFEQVWNKIWRWESSQTKIRESSSQITLADWWHHPSVGVVAERSIMVLWQITIWRTNYISRQSFCWVCAMPKPESLAYFYRSMSYRLITEVMATYQKRELNLMKFIWFELGVKLHSFARSKKRRNQEFSSITRKSHWSKSREKMEDSILYLVLQKVKLESISRQRLSQNRRITLPIE